MTRLPEKPIALMSVHSIHFPLTCQVLPFYEDFRNSHLVNFPKRVQCDWLSIPRSS